ncbi:MAG: TonB-dependent receptor [Flavobacteriales bacterium]
MKYLLGAFLIAFSTSIVAQDFTISGSIKDNSNGEDIIGATVMVKEIPGTGATANVYGFYSLTIPKGTYTLVYSSIGYATIEKKVVLEQSTKINIELKEKSTQIKTFTVSDEAEDKNVSGTEMGIEKLDPQSIEAIPVLLGEKDIVKTFTLMPGIKSAGEGNGGFFVRGGGADQNLILLDEAVVYNASHLLGFFSVFNSDAIKDVSLYKGGMPAEYGGRGSSVMDITMKDGNNKKFGASGGLGVISSRLTLEGPIVKDKGSFIVSGRRSYADLFLKLSKDENLKQSKLYFYDLNLKANYKINEKNRVFLSGYFGRDVFGVGDAFGFNWGNATGTLRWNHLFSDKLFSNTSLIASNYDYEFKIGGGDDAFGVKASILDYNIKQDFSYFLNDKNTIKFGLNSIYHTFSPGELTATNESFTPIKLNNVLALENALYIQNEQKFSEVFSIQYGLRYSFFNYMGNNDSIKTFNDDGIQTDINYFERHKTAKFYGGFEPRLAAKYMLDESSSVKLSYNRNYQYIHLLSNTTAASPTDSWVPSSLNIKPQIIDQISIGYFKNFKKNTYEFSVETYYKNLQNQIDYRDGAELFLNGDVEEELAYGKGIAYGAEFYLKKNKGKFTGWLSYTYSRSLRKFDKINNGDFYPARQDLIHDISIVGIYKINDKWTASASWVYTTGIAVTFPEGRYEVEGVIIPYYSDRNGSRFPDYHRLDVGVTWYNKKTDKFESNWNFSVYNAYARENTYSIAFVPDPDNPAQTVAEQTALFKIIPSVTYNFKF